MFADGSVSEVAAAVWVTGFRTDYSWLDLSGAVVDDTVADARGITGLSIVGLTWLHTPRVGPARVCQGRRRLARRPHPRRDGIRTYPGGRTGDLFV